MRIVGFCSLIFLGGCLTASPAPVVSTDFFSSVPDKACAPRLQVEFLSPHTEFVSAGSANVPLHTMQFTALCADISLSLVYIFESPDQDPIAPSPIYCAEPCEGLEDWNFRDFEVRDNSGHLLFRLNPQLQPKQKLLSVSSEGHSFKITKDTAVIVTLEVSLPDPLPSTAVSGKRFITSIFNFDTSADVEQLNRQAEVNLIRIE